MLNIKLYNHYFTGYSPLYVAAENGRVQMVKMLLDEEGINTNLQSNSGKYLFCISNQMIVLNQTDSTNLLNPSVWIEKEADRQKHWIYGTVHNFNSFAPSPSNNFDLN